MFLVKFNSEGVQQWRTDISTDDSSGGRAVALDAAGNPVVVASAYGSFQSLTDFGSSDFLVAKFSSSDGSLIWATQFGTGDADGLNSIAISSSGNIFVTGNSLGSFNGTDNAGIADIFVARLSSSGSLVWARQLGTYDYDGASSIAVDSTNNVLYVVGDTGADLDGNTYQGGAGDAFVAKYDMDGNKLWVKLLGTVEYDTAASVVLGSTGDIFVTGSTNGAFLGSSNAGGSDVFLAKMNSSGTVLWVRQFGTSGDEYSKAIASDPAGGLYVSGDTDGNLGSQTSNGDFDAFIASLDADGNVQRVYLYGTQGGDSCEALAVDQSSRVVFGGRTDNQFPGFSNSGSFDAYVTKFA